MAARSTKGELETACEALNAAAKDLGLDRRFQVRFGSAQNGIAHCIDEYHPGLSHPTVSNIGRTYDEAARYLYAMRHALESVKRDRDYRTEDARSGAVSGNSMFEEPWASQRMSTIFEEPDGRGGQ